MTRVNSFRVIVSISSQPYQLAVIYFSLSHAKDLTSLAILLSSTAVMLACLHESFPSNIVVGYTAQHSASSQSVTGRA